MSKGFVGYVQKRITDPNEYQHKAKSKHAETSSIGIAPNRHERRKAARKKIA